MLNGRILKTPVRTLSNIDIFWTFYSARCAEERYLCAGKCCEWKINGWHIWCTFIHLFTCYHCICTIAKCEWSLKRASACVMYQKRTARHSIRQQKRWAEIYRKGNMTVEYIWCTQLRQYHIRYRDEGTYMPTYRSTAHNVMLQLFCTRWRRCRHWRQSKQHFLWLHEPIW